MSSVQTIEVHTAPAYEVTIGAGLLRECGARLKTVLGGCRIAVVADSNVAPLYLETVCASLRDAGFAVCSYVFPAGEAHKNFTTLSAILEFLAESQLTRTDCVAALGGGVTGDMAGFAAASYLRGIRYVQLPTTLLSAVDSSVGGKTAIDLAAGKNLAGAFLQPAAVLCDTDCLKSLPAAVFADGAAEAIKTGVLSGETLFSLFEDGTLTDAPAEVIARCIRYKAGVVERDEKEQGERRKLNLGHTVGHVRAARLGRAGGVRAHRGVSGEERPADRHGLSRRGAGESRAGGQEAQRGQHHHRRAEGHRRLRAEKDPGDGASSHHRRRTGGLRMDIRIRPHALAGAVTPPPSKSMAHRLLLAAALADGVSTVKNVALSQDIEATLRCMAALGASWERTDKSTLRVTGIGGKGKTFPELPRFDCGESGSTLRFLIPIALAVAGGGVFTGRGRLMERPQKPYFDLFDEKGISYEQTAGVLTVRGTLTPGEYRLAGNVSSQFFTGLLFALPLLGGGSTLVSTTRLESRDYVAMTRDALARAGVRIDGDAERFAVPPSVYRSFDAAVEADWSQAGFWYAARFLGNGVEVCGLNENSAQGDRVVKDLLERFKAAGEQSVDVSDCPDLLPPLAVMAARREGTTHFVNAARLRMKESDRLTTTAALLRALGVPAEETADSLTVRGMPSFSGGTVDGANDHRIVMAAAAAATAAAAPVTVAGAEAVRKSYPSFWEEYKRLGGSFDVL